MQERNEAAGAMRKAAEDLGCSVKIQVPKQPGSISSSEEEDEEAEGEDAAMTSEEKAAKKADKDASKSKAKSGLFKATLVFFVFKLGQILSSALIQLYNSSKIGLLLCHSLIELRLS